MIYISLLNEHLVVFNSESLVILKTTLGKADKPNV